MTGGHQQQQQWQGQSYQAAQHHCLSLHLLLMLQLSQQHWALPGQLCCRWQHAELHPWLAAALLVHWSGSCLACPLPCQQVQPQPVVQAGQQCQRRI
jgi:hypothetical protein